MQEGNTNNISCDSHMIIDYILYKNASCDSHVTTYVPW